VAPGPAIIRAIPILRRDAMPTRSLARLWIGEMDPVAAT
jgi:hypothetical protein